MLPVKRDVPNEALPGGRYAFIVLLGLLACFWWPALRDGKLILHGDSGYHGLPLLWLHAQGLAGLDELLWSSRVYGGHPIFAEGQGGFANPLNILVVWLFEPLRAMGVLHWATLAIGGGGVFSLCRILGIGPWSATFAAVAAVFSGAWTFNQHDYPVMSTLAWMPWLLAAVEYWLWQPSLRRAATMAIPAALLVLGGYPQVTHGALLYLLTALSARAFQKEGRVFLGAQWRSILRGSLLATLLAAGLAGVQFVPLLELIGESSRSQGVGILDQALFRPEYLQGLLYFGTGDSGQGATLSMSGIAVVALAGLTVLLRLPVRIAGQMFGAFLLFNLGMGASSPIFRAAYAHHLIPGLHYFRIDYPYLTVAVVGISVVAAYMLDTLASDFSSTLRGALKANSNRWFLRGAAIVYVGGIAFLCYRSHMPEFSALNFLAPLLLLLSFMLLAACGRRRWLPFLAVLILAVDVLVLRVPGFVFHDRQTIAVPQNLRAIVAEPDRQDYKVMDHSIAILMALLSPHDPRIERDFRRLLNAMTPFTMAFQWQTPSINGVSGLHLFRRTLIAPTLGAEILGGESNRPGLRLIDILGIRYISRDAEGSRPGLTLFSVDNPQDAYQHMFVYRNPFAKPRFQVYWHAETTDSAEQALAGLKAARDETLFIERKPGQVLSPSSACPTCAADKPVIEVVEARATRYRVNVVMPREGWLFLADANYPGWESMVNGVTQPLYSAQVLGKAVHLGVGRNQVIIRYMPRSFIVGVVLSALSLIVLLCILLWQPLRRCVRAAGDRSGRGTGS